MLSTKFNIVVRTEKLHPEGGIGISWRKAEQCHHNDVLPSIHQIGWKQPKLGNSSNSSISACLRFPMAGCGWLPISSITSNPLSYSSETFKDSYLCPWLSKETSVGFRHANMAHHAPSNKRWIFSAPKLGAPKLSFKKSKHPPNTLQVWALYNMDLSTYFHLQKGMQVCKGFGKKYATAKIQISLVISKYLLDLSPPHPSAQDYISSKCNKSYWRGGLKDKVSFQILTCLWDESWE